MTEPPVEISVVIPVYGCAGNLGVLHDRLVSTLSTLNQPFEIVLVDDCGPDDSWERLRGLAAADHRVRATRLSRNFGQHAAITAGLAESRGRWIVVMDCDLQDPPEEIPRLYAKALEGSDIVFARRLRRRHSLFRRLAARAYFGLLQRITGTPVDDRYGSFSMISRKVVDAYLRFRDCERHYLFILYWLGFKSTAIDYAHHDRNSGESSYTLTKLIRHALSGVFSQTTAILHWIVYVGLVMSALGILLAVYLLYRYLVYSVQQPGWTSLAVMMLVISGISIVTTGVSALYVGKIFEQVKDRPLFVVDRRIREGIEQ